MDCWRNKGQGDTRKIWQTLNQTIFRLAQFNQDLKKNCFWGWNKQEDKHKQGNKMHLKDANNKETET